MSEIPHRKNAAEWLMFLIAWPMMKLIWFCFERNQNGATDGARMNTDKKWKCNRDTGVLPVRESAGTGETPISR